MRTQRPTAVTPSGHLPSNNLSHRRPTMYAGRCSLQTPQIHITSSAHKADKLNAIFEQSVKELWEPRRLTSLSASTAGYKGALPNVTVVENLPLLCAIFWGQTFIAMPVKSLHRPLY
jgi:hypothetical protein